VEFFVRNLCLRTVVFGNRAKIVQRKENPVYLADQIQRFLSFPIPSDAAFSGGTGAFRVEIDRMPQGDVDKLKITIVSWVEITGLTGKFFRLYQTRFVGETQIRCVTPHHYEATMLVPSGGDVILRLHKLPRKARKQAKLRCLSDLGVPLTHVEACSTMPSSVANTFVLAKA
jgi:hypothetical protein